MNIRLLQREDIDVQRWNGCVHYATNGNVFGYVWFLDHVGKNWIGLVEDEYHSVMPLVIKRDRWGRESLTQPTWMREMGIYSVRALSPPRIDAFMQAIPERFRKVDIMVHGLQKMPSGSEFDIIPQSNYFLDLNPPFESLADQFESSLFKKWEMAREAGLLPVSNPNPERIAEFFVQHGAQPEVDQHALLRIMYNILHRGWGSGSGIQNAEGELQAVNFFVYSHSRAMSLVPIVSNRGREQGALEYLFHFFLQRHAGSSMTLDFNTGDNAFTKQFGAYRESYYQLRRDKRLLGIW